MNNTTYPTVPNQVRWFGRVACLREIWYALQRPPQAAGQPQPDTPFNVYISSLGTEIPATIAKIRDLLLGVGGRGPAEETPEQAQLRAFERRRRISVELAVLHHYGSSLEPIFTANEGDGADLFDAYHRLDDVRRLLNPVTPRSLALTELLERVATALGITLEAADQLRIASITPAFDYYTNQLVKHDETGVSPANSYLVLRAAAMWHPGRARLMALNDAMVDQVAAGARGAAGRPAIPWITREIIRALKAEVPAYQAYIRDLAVDAVRHVLIFLNDLRTSWRHGGHYTSSMPSWRSPGSRPGACASAACCFSSRVPPAWSDSGRSSARSLLIDR